MIPTAVQILTAPEQQAKLQLGGSHNIFVLSLLHVHKYTEKRAQSVDFIYQVEKQFVMSRKLRGRRNMRLLKTIVSFTSLESGLLRALSEYC